MITPILVIAVVSAAFNLFPLSGRLLTVLDRSFYVAVLAIGIYALVANGKDDRIIAITGNGDGIAVIDLSSIPKPAPVTWLSAIAAPAVTWSPLFPETSSRRLPGSPLHRIGRMALHSGALRPFG
jgi:hypothetical protein